MFLLPLECPSNSSKESTALREHANESPRQTRGSTKSSRSPSGTDLHNDEGRLLEVQSNANTDNLFQSPHSSVRNSKATSPLPGSDRETDIRSPQLLQHNSTDQPTDARSPSAQVTNSNNSSTPSTCNRKDSSSQTDKSYVLKGGRISDFEREIKKLLERQRLPPVDELASVEKVLSVMEKFR